jgi:polyisoprenyl-phosphate glycosyltransferase
MMAKKKISIVAGCYNEEENIPHLYKRITEAMTQHPQHDFEIILIDNASQDKTFSVIKEIASRDPRMKGIRNTRNFGHIRSPYYAFLSAQGDAVIAMASDLEDPPELISDFVRKWDEGFKVVIGVRKTSDEVGLFPILRKAYYYIISRISSVEQISNFTGFGLYDKEVMDQLRNIDDPYPYFRGLISELGYARAEVKFNKPVRQYGISKGNIFVYADTALLAVVNNTLVPLRLATISGALISSFSMLVAFFYLFKKIMYWDSFDLGVAPIVVGGFALFGIIFLFLGLIGEYIGLLVRHTIRRPLVVVDETVNLDE